MKHTQHTALILAFTATSAFASPSTYSGGHADIGVALENGTDFHLHAHLHGGAIVDGSPLAADTEFDANELVISVADSTATPITSSIPAAGVNNGDTLWILPQANPNNTTVPFLGIGTEELAPADWTGDIEFALDSVVSPSGTGTFSLWQTVGINTLEFLFSSADASLTKNGDNTLGAQPGSHDHYNWGFSEIGDWEVTLTASGVHDTLGSLSDTQIFSFTVVPEPSAATWLFAPVLLLLARRRTVV
jgi:surface-anchored protein